MPIDINAPVPSVAPTISENDRRALNSIAAQEVVIELHDYLPRIGVTTPLAEKDQVIFAKGDGAQTANGFYSQVYDHVTIHFALPYRATTEEERDLYRRAINVTSPQLVQDGWVKELAGKEAIDKWSHEREIELAEYRAEIKMTKAMSAMQGRNNVPRFMTSRVG